MCHSKSHAQNRRFKATRSDSVLVTRPKSKPSFSRNSGTKIFPKKKNQGGPKICPPSNTHKKVKIRRRESTNLRQTSYSRNSQTTRRFGIPIVDSHSFLATDNGLKIPARVARQKDLADIRAPVCHCSLYSHSLTIRCLGFTR